MQTRKKTEEELNEIGCPIDDHPENGGRVPWSMICKYGTWMRKNDPIAFSVYHNERVQEEIRS